MVTLLSCRCRLDASRGLVVVATWSVGSRLGGQKGGVALHVSCSAVTPGELSVPVLGMSYPSVPTKEQTTADSVCYSVRYRAIAGPLVCLVLASGSSGIDSDSDPGPGSSGASLMSTPGSGSGCDSCSGSESGSVGNLGSMLTSVVNMAMRTPSPRCLTIGASQWQLSIRPQLWGVAPTVA